MTSTRGAALFALGMLLTFGAVGGIENSLTDRELLMTVAAAVVGLVMMWFGVEIIKVDSSND